MATLLDGDIIEVAFDSFFANQFGVMVYHYQIGFSTGNGGTDAQLATALGAIFPGLIKPLMTASATYNGLRVTKIFPLPRLIPVLNETGQGPGGYAGDPMPRQVAGILTIQTPLAGRKNRGRKYIPFPAEDANNNGIGPNAFYQTSMSLLGGALITPVTFGTAPDTGNAFPVIYHRNDHTVTSITAYRVNTKWATQRRRGSYGRPNV